LRRTNPQLAELVTEELARARHLMAQQKVRRGDLFREASR
jgi:hypothetical protein